MGQNIQSYETVDPSTPASGFGTIYPKTDGHLYWKSAAGLVTRLDGTLTAGTNITITANGDGTYTISSTGGGGGGGSASWIIKTSNYTALAGDNVLADTSGGAFTITLPATPNQNDTVRVRDLAQFFSVNNLTIANNGSKINGIAANLSVNGLAQELEFVYSNATYGWTTQALLNEFSSGGFNPADAGACIRLTANNREIATTSLSSWQGSALRGLTSHTTGQFYFEMKVLKLLGNSNGIYIGIADNATDITFTTTNIGGFNHSYADGAGGFAVGTGTGTGGTNFSYTTGDVIGVAFDGTAHTCKWYKNNVLQSTVTGIEANAFFPAVSLFDQGARGRISTQTTQFAFTPPTGYSAWES